MPVAPIILRFLLRRLNQLVPLTNNSCRSIFSDSSSCSSCFLMVRFHLMHLLHPLSLQYLLYRLLRLVGYACYSSSPVLRSFPLRPLRLLVPWLHFDLPRCSCWRRLRQPPHFHLFTFISLSPLAPAVPCGPLHLVCLLYLHSCRPCFSWSGLDSLVKCLRFDNTCKRSIYTFANILSAG